MVVRSAPIVGKRIVLCTLVFLNFCLSAAEAADKSRSLALLQKRYDELTASFQTEMEAVAKLCEAGSFFQDAAQIRLRAVPASQQTLDLDALPATLLPDLPPDLPAPEKEWRAKLRKLEQDHATALYKVARDGLNQEHFSFAFQLIREVAFHDPNHKFARNLLGYKRQGDNWTTPFTLAMESKGREYDETFGWLPKAHIARYHQGERNYNGKWISAEREAALRSDFQQAWEVETEHFLVRTNQSLETGVQLGEELESFHKYFVREFAPFFNTPAQMQRLFDKGEGSAGASRRYTVYYFRDKDEYVQHLIAEQPQIAITNGLYLPRKRIAYFFHDAAQQGANLETMYHEVTHQLLSESTPRQIDVGQHKHFWVIEGIACYMESYRRVGDQMQIGDPHHPRFYYARQRLIGDNEFYGFEQFAALGMLPFQQAGDVATLQKYYAQAASMCHFYLNYSEGVYRDAFIAHLSQLYSPTNGIREKAAGMDVLTGVPYDLLQQQYRDHLTSWKITAPPPAAQ